MESISKLDISTTSTSSGHGIGTSSSKSRREMFEEQLRDLQKDISNLSSKLSVPAMVTANRLQSKPSFVNSTQNGSTILSNTSYLDQSALSGNKTMETSILSNTPTYQQHKDVANIHGQSLLSAKAPHVVTAPDLLYSQHKYDHLDHALRDALREKDIAQRQLEQANKEIEELRKGVAEYAKLKASYDSLKQDHDAMKISLQSSERIRLQQKELIAVLQKSQHMMSSSNSVLTFGTNLSSIPGTSTNSMGVLGGGGRDSDSEYSSLMPPSLQSMSNHAGKVPSHVLAVTNNSDHRQWLNATSSSPAGIPSVVHIPRPSSANATNRTPSKNAPKGRSSSAGRPPRASTVPSNVGAKNSTTTPKRSTTPSKSAATNTPSSAVKGRAIVNSIPSPNNKPPVIPPVITQPLDSSTLLNIQRNLDQQPLYGNPTPFENVSIASSNKAVADDSQMRINGHSYPHSGDSILSLMSPYPPSISSATQPMQSSVGNSAAQVSAPPSTSTLLTSLLLNQDLINTPSAASKHHVSFTKDTVSPKKRPVTRKGKMTKKAANGTNRPATSSSASSRKNSMTHITPSKSTSSRSSARPVTSKSVGDGDIRVLYRPVPSPVSSFSKARRL